MKQISIINAFDLFIVTVSSRSNQYFCCEFDFARRLTVCASAVDWFRTHCRSRRASCMCDALPNPTAEVHAIYMRRSATTLLNGYYPTYSSTRSTENNGDRCNSPAIIRNGGTLSDHSSDDKTSDQENDESPIFADVTSSSSVASVPPIKEMCISDIGDSDAVFWTAEKLPADVLRTTTVAGENGSCDHGTCGNTAHVDNRKDGRNEYDPKSLSGQIQ